MFSPCSRLPSEVWTQVFGYLSPTDSLRVRAVCKDFRDLVDTSGLWKEWTVTLKSAKSAYNKQFWRTLRRWRVSSAVLSSPRGWTHISTELPRLTTLIIDSDSDAALDSLQCFTNLQRVYLKRPKCMSFEKLFPLLPPRLMHLSVCEFDHKRMPFMECLMNCVTFKTATHLTNLTSLVCHTSFAVEPELVLPTILSALPQLTHLSLLGPSDHGFPVHYEGEQPSLRHRSLSSLEIIEYVYDLSDDIMKMVPSLRCLALFFSRDYIVSEHFSISSWLRDLPALSSLLIVGGPHVSHFVGSIPSSVTQLTLRPVHISTSEMTALSTQLPNLQHLHLEPCAFLGPDTALLPRFFPGLHSLRVRHERVPEETFLSLATLTELQLLETQDPEPPSVALVSKLRELTNNRLQISHRPERNRLRTCNCVSYLPTENWAKVWH